MKNHYLVILFILFCRFSLSSQTISSWRSDDNACFVPQNSIQFQAGNGKYSAKIIIDDNVHYQTIDGFGWTMTQGAAKLIMGMAEQDRISLLNDLYSTAGLCSEIVRIGVGATDLSEYPYTYEDSKGKFSLEGPDLTDLIPVLKLIKNINPNIKFLATPWTAPKWMKTNGSYTGGQLREFYREEYADYLVKYCLAMKEQELPISFLSIQNEPLAEHNNPSMKYTANDMYAFANILGPKMKTAGLENIKLIGYDHNCDNTDFPIRVAESEYINGTAFHMYKGDINTMFTVYNATDKDVYFTEQYSSGTGHSQSDFNWHIKNIMIGSLNNMSKATFAWNAAAKHTGNGQYEPHTNGGCSDCMGAVTINENTYSKNTTYYTIAHLSKVVRAGAKRIGITKEGTAQNLDVVAFNNNDGTMSLIVHNASGTSRNIEIALADNYFYYTIGSWTTVSFLWKSDVTGINNISSNSTVSVFPNPVNDVVNVRFDTQENRSYELFSISGNKMLDGKMNDISNTIDMENLSTGVYLLKIQHKSDSYYSKIIKN